MALIKGTLPVLAQNIVKGIEILPNFNLNANQVGAGLVAKVQVRWQDHITFTVNIWKGRGGTNRIYGTTSAQKGNSRYFALVNLKKEVFEYIVAKVMEMKDSNEQSEPWYFRYEGERTLSGNNSSSNEDLGITDITVDTNLTSTQITSGILGKATIHTPIGEFFSYTIFKSNFGQQLFGSVPEENTPERGQRGTPAYNLSRDVIAQVMRYIHTNLVDWDAEMEVSVAPPVVENSTVIIADVDGFKPVEGLDADVIFDGADDKVKA